ncbi:MAG: histidine kinase [Clostridiales bacterium]|nr:histidine kinase [Clostridiales bacterium]
MDNIDENLEALESYLYQNFSDSEEIVCIETVTDENALFMAKQDLTRTLSKIVGWNSSLRFLFFYAPVSQDGVFLRVSSQSLDYNLQVELEEQIQDYINGCLAEGTTPAKGYYVAEAGGMGFLIRFYKVRNSYIGMCLTGESVLEPLENLLSAGDCYAFLCDINGNIYSATDNLEGQIEADQNGIWIKKEGERFLQLSCLSADEDFYIVTWTKFAAIQRQMRESMLLIFSFVIGAILFMIVIVVAVQRALCRPIVEMEKGMHQVQEGEWNLVVQEESRIEEYNSMIKNFNSMVSRIKDLKIENYEKELSVQKTYLQYLQLQVNPHFYLNALNIIYSLAQVGNCELIQKMTMSLVEYSRYMFREPGSMVTIAQEMEHVENYMKIQTMRFPDRIDFKPVMSSEIEDALIPPFIIQSFVENSIKYAVNFEQRNVLSIQGNLAEIDEEPYVRIEIRDNGTGYSQEVLELIEAKDDPADAAGNRVGIRNVKKRLQLVFGDQAKLILENQNGAVTTILVPLLWSGEEDENGQISHSSGR